MKTTIEKASFKNKFKLFAIVAFSVFCFLAISVAQVSASGTTTFTLVILPTPIALPSAVAAKISPSTDISQNGIMKLIREDASHFFYGRSFF